MCFIEGSPRDRRRVAERSFFFSHHPIYTVAVKAANSNDDEKVGAALKDLCTYDKSLTLENSRELRQVILGCQGELHLNTIKWYFENQYKLGVNFTAPNIPYRETITKPAEAMYRHKKQSGGSGQLLTSIYIILRCSQP